jgi:hypothetical protein
VSVASAVLLLAAACGGGGSDGNGSDGSAASDGQNVFAGYADCMKKNGVKLDLPSDFPSGRPFPRRSGEPGSRPSGFPTAFPSGFPTVRPSGFPDRRPPGAPGGPRGGFGRPPGVDDATWQKAQDACRSVLPSFGPGGGQRGGAFTAYRNCLNDHGVTAGGGLQGLNTADPKTAAALKACAVLRPTSVPTAAPSPTS